MMFTISRLVPCALILVFAAGCTKDHPLRKPITTSDLAGVYRTTVHERHWVSKGVGEQKTLVRDTAFAEPIEIVAASTDRFAFVHAGGWLRHDTLTLNDSLIFHQPNLHTGYTLSFFPASDSLELIFTSGSLYPGEYSTSERAYRGQR